MDSAKELIERVIEGENPRDVLVEGYSLPSDLNKYDLKARALKSVKKLKGSFKSKIKSAKASKTIGDIVVPTKGPAKGWPLYVDGFVMGKGSKTTPIAGVGGGMGRFGGMPDAGSKVEFLLVDPMYSDEFPPDVLGISMGATFKLPITSL